jgi:hypothetical protein
MIEGEQRLIESLRRQAQELEARGGDRDREAAEAILLKISALQAKLDGLAARHEEPSSRDRRWGARILARLFGE